ncbi:ABC transporter permease [Paenibacillus thermotolerans]|uniref:ABC transporter permease n=1 Tax=Paenibacillus thermotolerans TaxID=3027807 RepID=UPI0023679BF7|nr:MULTISPECIES: ABC transporter permease [unclassified Paenibacillus]
MERMKRISSWWPPVVTVLLFLILWQGAVWLWSIPKYILPGPAAIADAAAREAPIILRHAGSTLGIAVVGLLIGSAVGMLAATLLHFSSLAKSGLWPLLILTQNVPIVVLAPILVSWFGFGVLPKLILLTIVCFFPVAIAMMDGLLSADRTMRNYMLMAGADRRQMFFKLELPWAVPSLFSGLKISAAYSVLSSVFAEWVGSKSGIGYYLQLKKAGFQVDGMFAAVFVIVGLSILLYGLMVLLERSLTGWRRNRT